MSKKSYDKHRERYLDAAKAFQKERITQSNRLEIRHQDAELIRAVREGLKGLKGRSMAEKILMLLEHYYAHPSLPADRKTDKKTD